MPSWKKLITSGSSAVLSNITLSNLQTQGSELTSVMVNTGGVVGTRELSSTAFSTMDNYGSFTAAGDVGVDQTISSGNTLTFTGTNGITTTGVAGDSVDIALNATQTGITSVLNTGLIVGRDAHNQIDFATTDNEIHFKTNNETPVIKMKAAGEIEATSLDISGGVDIAGAITSAEWTGDVIASAYLDADTAHLTTTQTFSGAKTFSSLASFTMDGNTITGVDDSGEFTDDDAHIMTSAAVQDKILGYGYTTEVGDITGVTAGTGMSGGGTSGTVTLTNAGVTSNVAGTGISVSGATGAVTITNAGVTSNVAGDLIDVSGATGAVTVNVDL
jgi:hypothetical protein